ncbi:MAG: hypothetical protein KDA24_20005, partial [Deltaproteobacteria bacterium]|nr:hypothetical protein [Deltaproteobacteria bacterium]
IRDDAPRRRISFESSFRGGTDLSRGGFRAEVLTAFVDLEPTHRWGLVRIGRQVVTTSGAAGFTRLDGIRARMTLHRVGVEAFAGVPLRTRLIALQPVDGTPESDAPAFQTGWGQDFTWGAAVFLAGHKATQLRFGIQDRLKNGQLARRHLTLDFSQGIATRVLVRVNGAADLLQRRINDAHIGVEGRPLDFLKVGFDYHHWQPSFDATEIWSVFATDAYDQLEGRVVIAPHPAISGWVAGGAQLHKEPVTADNVPRPEVGVTSATVRGGVTIRPLPWLRVQITERFLGGTAGDKLQVGGAVRITPWKGRLSVSVRADVQRYAFAFQEKLAGDYGSVGAELAGSPVPWLRARISGDAILTPWLDNQFQLSASLQFLMGAHLRRGVRSDARVGAWEPALLAAAGMRDPRDVAPMPGLDAHGRQQ